MSCMRIDLRLFQTWLHGVLTKFVSWLQQLRFGSHLQRCLICIVKSFGRLTLDVLALYDFGAA
jgi:hypothetical protein